MSSYGQDPFALKKCLSGDALRTVKGVDDDFTEMFHRLDIKYGRPEKQADAVLNEIKKLKSSTEGDDRAKSFSIYSMAYFSSNKNSRKISNAFL
jgi:hypothetical protein